MLHGLNWGNYALREQNPSNRWNRNKFESANGIAQNGHLTSLFGSNIEAIRKSAIGLDGVSEIEIGVSINFVEVGA